VTCVIRVVPRIIFHPQAVLLGRCLSDQIASSCLPSSLHPDFALVERCLRGERAAQELLYARHAPTLFAVCKRYASTREHAEDLLQDGFIRAFRALSQYRGEGPLEGWLRRIVVRMAINQFHAAAVRPTEVDLMEAADLSTADHDALAQLSADDLRNVIQQLPDGYRIVLNLYCFEGYQHREIADLLGIDERTSSSQLAKARRKLLTLLRRPTYAFLDDDPR
jgi:RNA polymerase sigma factor (sigma-70 family)